MHNWVQTSKVKWKMDIGCLEMKIENDRSWQGGGSVHNGHGKTKSSKAAMIQSACCHPEAFGDVKFNFRQKTSWLLMQMTL